MNEVSFLFAPNQLSPHSFTACLQMLEIPFTATHDKRSCQCQGKGHCEDCYKGKWHKVTINWEGPSYEAITSDPFLTRILTLRQSNHAADWITAFIMLVEENMWEEALWSYLSCFIHGDEDATEWDSYKFAPRAAVLQRARAITLSRMKPHARQMLRQTAETWLAAPYTDPRLGEREWCGFGIAVDYLREAIQPL